MSRKDMQFDFGPPPPTSPAGPGSLRQARSGARLGQAKHRVVQEGAASAKRGASSRGRLRLRASAASAASSGPSGQGQCGQRCFFKCGAVRHVTPCPVNPEKKIEWEYNNGNADKHCGQVFKAKYAHKMTREEVREEMEGQDRSFREEFLDYRNTLVQRKKNGKKGLGKGLGSPKAARRFLKKRKRHTTELQPPAPDCLPWKEYEAKFDVKLMKKRGHTLKKIEGRKMVIMPAAAGTPWKLQTKYATDILDEEEIAADNESGIESDDDVIADKFDDMVQQSDDAIAEVTGGMTFAQMLEEASKSAKPTTTEPTVDGSGGDASQLATSPTKKVKRKRQRGFIESGSESPEPPRGGKAKAKAKAKARAKKAAGANAAGRGAATTPVKTTAAAGAAAGGASPGAGGAAAAGGEAPSGGGQAADGAGAQSTPGRRGPKKHSALQVAERELKIFNGGNASSTYFNQHWFTANRCVKRYIDNAITEEAAEKDVGKKLPLTIARKQLQYIDEGQRCYQKWASARSSEGGDGNQAYSERVAGWRPWNLFSLILLSPLPSASPE